MQRAYALVLSGILAVGIVVPMFGDRDGYPLSNYPMFSYRIDAVNNVSAVVGRDAAGERHLLSPGLIGGADEVMLALQTVGNAIGAGPAATADLCAAVAQRLAEADRGDIERVEVVTESYDTVAWFSGDEEPIAARVHAACEVAG